MSERARWASGTAYEPYVGRWSRLVARRFIDWLDPPPDGRWLDVGCGTGALTGTILQAARPASVHGVDPSEEFVAFAREHITDRRATFETGDARRIPGQAGRYDHTVSGLVLNFVPEPGRALAEMNRVTRGGGWIAAYVWDYAEGMELMRFFWDAATELDPGAAPLDEGTRFTICRPEPLRALWEEAALDEVEVVPIEIDTVFRDFDDYWGPFLGGEGPAPAYAMSLKWSARQVLEALLRRRLPVADDGGIHLRARAWGVRGKT